jgi:putative ATPase
MMTCHAGVTGMHDEPDAIAAGEKYCPDAMAPRTYYHPVPRGLEIRIAEALERLRNRNRGARKDEQG